MPFRPPQITVGDSILILFFLSPVGHTCDSVRVRAYLFSGSIDDKKEYEQVLAKFVW